MKQYNLQYNIGNAKYVANFHNGQKFHKDNSPFFDIKIFSNKKDFTKFCKQLEKENFVQK